MSKLLKNKKLIVIIAVLLAAAVVAAVLISVGVKDKKEEKQISGYLNQKLETYGELNIISDAVEVDGSKYSVASVKEAIRLGANTVTLDLCFNEDNVPVICGSYDEITKDTLRLEEIFKLMNEEKYSSNVINLRLRQLGSLSVFNRLFEEYNMSGKVIISGIDKNRYSLISGDSTAAGIFFDYTPDKDVKKSLDEIRKMEKEYGISGVIIDSKDITQELAEELNQRGIVFIVGSASEEIDMYSALNAGASNIETPSPEEFNRLYSEWKEQTKENMEKSVLAEVN